MKKYIPIILLNFIIGLGSITAQTFVGKLNPYPAGSVVKTSNEDTLHILAVLVEFQEDEDNATFGDGKFGSIYTVDYGTDIIDPLPHDAEYFKDHLEFAKNYFYKVSGGNLVIDYTVMSNILEMPLTMRDYSPNPAESDDFLPLADFCKDVWELADQDMSTDFSKFDLFTIFHAGVGRDIQVPGSIGNDRDLPSVYLSASAFKSIYGEEFNGFTVNGGQFNITNTMILPETESRELTSFDETSLIQLSINGLIAGSIASHLGLPDLFDTNTGLSSIGRFGLMDGQSLFTFGGLFPPEPSPWEKIYLGWANYETINTPVESVTLVASAIAEAGDTTLVKVPINSSEYYLIENRSRDAKQDGCKVTYRIGGQTFTKTFDKDYNTFISYDVDTLAGVVIDVDEYDWAVPPFDRNTDDLESFSDVGIVIWHIDESVIQEKIATNTINTDKFRKGVAVVEADGINDIGEEFQTVFGDVVIGEGSKEDTWYSSNPSELYKNVFNDDSKPSAKTNTGANTLISISDFSDIGTTMSFAISFGSNELKQIANVYLPGTDSDIEWINSVRSNNEETYFFSSPKGFVTSDSAGTTFNVFRYPIEYQPAAFSFNKNANVLFSNENDICLYIFRNSQRNFVTLRDSINITTPPVVKSISDKVEFVMGNAEGYVNVYELLADAGNTMNGIGLYKAFQDTVKQIAVDDNFIAAVSTDSYWDINSGTITLPSKPSSLLISKLGSNYVSIVLMADNSITVIKQGSISNIIDINADGVIEGISLADIKSDGSNYILVNTGSSIAAYNLKGGMAEYFPIECPADTKFINTPLAADLDNDNIADLVTLTEDGRIYSFSGSTGEDISPFPVSTGTEALSDPLLYSNGSDMNLIVLGQDSNLQLWSMPQASTKSYWSGTYANSLNTAFAGQAESVNEISEYFPTAKAYNWPNPVYEGQTYFRFYVAEDSKAEINIFDLAGDLVAKLNDNAAGGFDNEIAWDVSDIQSGVYFAHLSVEGASGNSAYKIIKVAVIK